MITDRAKNKPVFSFPFKILALIFPTRESVYIVISLETLTPAMFIVIDMSLVNAVNVKAVF